MTREIAIVFVALIFVSNVVATTQHKYLHKRNNYHSKYDRPHAMGPNPKLYQVTYDDGTQSPLLRIKVKEGESDSTSNPQFMSYEETLDGYTVQPSKSNNGKYVYVDVNTTSGDFIDTNLVAGVDDPYELGISKNVAKRRYTILQRRSNLSSSSSFEKQLGLDPEVRKSGTLKNLAVGFRFADHKDRILPSENDLQILMNNEGPHELCPSGSVRDVYLQTSYQKLNVESTVVAWVDIDFTESYCAAGSSGIHKNFFDCLRNALNEVVQLGINFSDFDQDNDGNIDAITFFHSGYAAEWGGIDSYGTHYNNRIWSHKWAIWTGSFESQGVKVYHYNVNPAVWDVKGSEIGRIGVVAHEIGHFLGLPDLYDYGDDVYGDGEGIGSFGLMANSWGFDGEQYYPPLMSPWSKKRLGYIQPIVAHTSGSYSLRQACDNPDVIIIRKGFKTQEYLLIENRQPCGFDTKLPAGGLAIFHIDEYSNNINGSPYQNGWPQNKNHYRVALLQADGDYDLERGHNRGDALDLFRAGFVDSIGPDGIEGIITSNHPNTNSYRNGIIENTGITITNIGESGTVMTFNILFGDSTLEPTKSPVKAPVSTPTSTPAPVQAPVSNPSTSTACEDSPFRLKIVDNGKKTSRSCSWVARTSTKSRCRIAGISETCAKTCDTCDELRDSTLRVRFMADGAYIARSCDWVKRRELKKRCAIPGMSDTCRLTCNGF